MVWRTEGGVSREVTPSSDRCRVKFQLQALLAHPCRNHPRPDVPAQSAVTELRSKSSVSVALKNLLAVLMPTSLLSRSEEGKDLVAYNPHRFVRQFGLDQGAMTETGKVCVGLRDAENQFTRAGRDRLFENYSKVYWPSLTRRESDRHWARCTELFKEFVHPNNPIPRQVPVPDLIRVRDLYLCESRHVGGEKMTMGSRNAEDETSDSPVPLRVEEPESSTPVPAKRKRKLTKPSASKPKKSKGSSSTTLTARVVEITFFYLELFSFAASLFALVNFQLTLLYLCL